MKNFDNRISRYCLTTMMGDMLKTQKRSKFIHKSSKLSKMNILQQSSNDNELNKQQEMLIDATLVKKIGQGFGGGTVYKAFEKGNPTPVALKLVDLSVHTHKGVSSDEGPIAYGLQHDNIVHTHQYYERNNHLMLHMEYLEGCSLSDQILQHGQIDFLKANEVINGVRRAVAYMHRNNVTHGDIHQGNIIIDENGGIKLIDFGCAKKHEGNSKHLEECKRIDNKMIRRLQNGLLQFMV